MSNPKDRQPAAPQLIDLPELPASAGRGDSLLGGNLDVIRNVQIRLTVQVGEVQTTVGDLMALRNDSVLKLDRLVDEPVDVLLDGAVIARGQLVAVGDDFGVRITELPKLGK
ncbi:FliM/FliN family flagellar motor switch protein [Chitinimonas lacunae]|uniref:Flagellar motor switch protein FliN n=1 Tax=Chitinimonas lacunae TaxID=1963018 RepID=A0ABV8MWV5_9NEIS